MWSKVAFLLLDLKTKGLLDMNWTNLIKNLRSCNIWKSVVDLIKISFWEQKKQDKQMFGLIKIY